MNKEFDSQIRYKFLFEKTLFHK